MSSRAPSSRCGRTRRATGRTTRSSSSASRRRCAARRRRRRTTSAYDCLPKLDVGLRRAADVRADDQGKMNGYFCQGFNPLLAFAQQEQGHGGAVEAQVPGHHRSARDRDGALLGEPRRVQRRRSRADPDRGHPAAGDLLRRGRGLAHQLRPLAAVALDRRRRLRAKRKTRHLRSWRRSVPAAARALREGGRRRSPIRSSSSTGPMRDPHDPDAGGAR